MFLKKRVRAFAKARGYTFVMRERLYQNGAVTETWELNMPGQGGYDTFQGDIPQLCRIMEHHEGVGSISPGAQAYLTSTANPV